MQPPQAHVTEIQLPPVYWNALSQEDKKEYLSLKNSFLHGSKISSKDRRIVTFSNELQVVRNFLERSNENQEARCILTGVCFAGPIVCVNTRQLKTFLSRCKSSINGSFQQLGYVALRTKSKARNCIISVLPSLQSQQNILRQWTVRVASEDAMFCFVTSFSNVQLPEILDEDLFPEKKSPEADSRSKPHAVFPCNQFRPAPHYPPPDIPDHFIQQTSTFTSFSNTYTPPAPLMPRKIQFDLISSDIGDYENSDNEMASSFMRNSFSMDTFKDNGDWDYDEMGDGSPQPYIPHSQSTTNDSFGWIFTDSF